MAPKSRPFNLLRWFAVLSLITHVFHGVICPSWQAKTRYAYGKVPAGVNSVGGVFVKIGGDGTMGLPRFVVQTTKDL